MKFPFITLLIIFASCNGNSQQKEQSKDTDEIWQVIKVRKQVHSYNKLGLLDTTYKVENLYHKGEPGAILDYLVIRKYDNNNSLISEKEFHIFKNTGELSDEKIFQYDAKNNLISETDKSENVVSEIIKTIYNNTNQKIKEMDIEKELDPYPKDWNIDSALAHHDDKKILHYDTLSIEFEYNTQRNLIKQFYKYSNQETGETVITKFSGTQIVLSFSLNSKGDTLSVTDYKKQGNLIAEITHEKRNPLFVETSLYDGNKKIQKISIDKKMNFRSKETYKYDNKGNEIENISYK